MFVQIGHIVGELLKGRTLDEVAHRIPEPNLVAVFGRYPQVEVNVRAPQRGVEATWKRQADRPYFIISSGLIQALFLSVL